jgi:hypothetical protein
MIFDEMDEDENVKRDVNNSVVNGAPVKNLATENNTQQVATTTQFLTLRRLKKLAQSEAQELYGTTGEAKQPGTVTGNFLPYTVVRAKEVAVHERFMNDGSENANDEFTRLSKDVSKWYMKLPGFQIMEDGYVKSRRKNIQNPTPKNNNVSLTTEAIYDSIS